MSTYSNYLLLLHCNEVLKGFTENVGGHSGPLTPQLWWPGQHFKWPRATGPPLCDPLLLCTLRMHNSEHGLVIVTESFIALNLNYTTSFVKVQISRSDAKSCTIPTTVYFPCALNWAKLVWTGYNLN